MKKVDGFGEVEVGSVFVARSDGGFRVLESKDFSTSEVPVKWRDLPVGTRYYLASELRREEAKTSFKFGGKGNLVWKKAKVGERSVEEGPFFFSLSDDKELDELCYVAKNMSPKILAVKVA